MALSFTKPTFNSAHPGPKLNETEETRLREARDTAHNTVATGVASAIAAINLIVPALNAILVQHVASGASLTGLTAGTNYKYLSLTYGVNYGAGVSGAGTGTQLMALTAAGNCVVMYWASVSV